MVGWSVGFNGISTLVCNLMPNSVYTHTHMHTFVCILNIYD